VAIWVLGLDTLMPYSILGMVTLVLVCSCLTYHTVMPFNGQWSLVLAMVYFSHLAIAYYSACSLKRSFLSTNNPRYLVHLTGSIIVPLMLSLGFPSIFFLLKHANAVFSSSNSEPCCSAYFSAPPSFSISLFSFELALAGLLPVVSIAMSSINPTTNSPSFWLF
jgi:hypothetical protein